MIPEAVVAAFGVDAAPQGLPGGEGTSVLAGDVVLKPTFDVRLADWCQQLAHAVDPDRLALPQPLRSGDGRWVVDGWTATRFVPGLTSLEDDAVRVAHLDTEVTAALTDAATGLDPLPPRADRWAIGVDAALGGPVPALGDTARAMVGALRERMGVAPSRSHIVHGDLTGNTFQALDGRVVVLDLSPYRSPPGFGAAVVVADHLLWRGGSADLAALAPRDLLARALVFRLIAEQLATAPRHGARLEDYERVLAALTP